VGQCRPPFVKQPLRLPIPTTPTTASDCESGDIRRYGLKLLKEMPFIGLFEDLKDVTKVRAVIERGGWLGGARKMEGARVLTGGVQGEGRGDGFGGSWLRAHRTLLTATHRTCQPPV